MAPTATCKAQATALTLYQNKSYTYNLLNLPQVATISTETATVSLPKYNIYLKLLIDGTESKGFSAVTIENFEVII